MGADIIIAVNVGTPLLKREELNAIFGVAGQMLSILTEQNVQASLASLKPDRHPHLAGAGGLLDRRTSTTCRRSRRSARRRRARWPTGSRSSPCRPTNTPRCASASMVAVVPDLRPVDEIRFDNLKRVNPEAAQAVMETERRPADRPGRRSTPTCAASTAPAISST